jgi:hypothetical protein
MPVDPDVWAALWRGISELSEQFPEGLVFIGGVAVYLHARAARLAQWGVEFSHDGDFYVSLVDFSDLRDMEEVTPNRRLSKYQFIKNRIEFDVYLEHNSTLRVPYADVRARSTVIDNVRVAALEHLLLLKLSAYADRRGSAKGRKDERDLVRIAHILSRQRLHKQWLESYLDPEDVDLLAIVLKSPEFVAMTQNVKQASGLRADFRSVLDAVRGLVEKSR